MQNFITFVKNTWTIIGLLREVFVSLLVLIGIGGTVIFFVEQDLSLIDSLYFAAITGMSIGYGDITPETLIGKIVSVAIGFVGVVFIGLIVAVATRALEMSADERLGITRDDLHRHIDRNQAD